MKRRELAPITFASPFTLMRRLSDDMERVFDEFGLRRPLGLLAEEKPPFEWAPAIEVFEKDKKLFVRAELPGLTKEDVKIDVTDELLTIQGERKQEKEEKEKGYIRTERFYGSFYREIALPEGAKPELAKALFKNGVLEIELPVEVVKPVAARRLQIEEKAEKVEKVVKEKEKELTPA
jgi:HSP20 family protein